MVRKCNNCTNGVAGTCFPHRCTNCDGKGNIVVKSRLDAFMHRYIGDAGDLEDLGDEFGYNMWRVGGNGEPQAKFEEVAKALNCTSDELHGALMRQFDVGNLGSDGSYFWEVV